VFKNLEPSEIFDVISMYVEIFGEGPNFFDEVQNLAEWQSVVRSLIDKGYNVFISGLSSKLLSKEIATQLRGRSLSYLLLPFSFREFLRLKNLETKNYYTLEEEGKVKNLLLNYLEEALIQKF